jgi:Family of unknown function (DUF5991)
MRKVARILEIAAVLCALATFATAQADWKGSYTFTENLGKNAGGVTMMVTHQIDIVEGGDGLAASVTSNGYQTSVDLMCSVKIVGTKLMIYFENYGEDNMFEPYTQGDLLLTLERKGKTLLTHWGKFTATFDKNQRSGKVYFEQIPVTKQ